MARPLRIEFPGAIYHVTSRGDRREPIYEDDIDRDSFLEICGIALERFDACMLAYCLMGNHYHLVIHTRQPNLSRLLRHINGVYTQTYNRRHNKVGHLFQGRFKAILVDGDAYLLEVCRYVELNPVRAGIVKAPEQWHWSSYLANTAQQIAPEWLDTHAVHSYLLGRKVNSNKDTVTPAKRYITLVAQGKDVNLWDSTLRQQIYLGDAAFVERMQALLMPAQSRANDVPKIQRRKAKPLAEYFQEYDRDEAILQAYRDGYYTMSAIAREVGLSVTRVSRLIAQEEKGKT